MSDSLERLGPYSEYADLMTQEQYDRMLAREPEAHAKYLEAEQQWKEFTDTATDEEIVRAYLRSRVLFWQRLPYDWMYLDVETLDTCNLLGCPPEVEAAYDRSRSDPEQRVKFEKDYGGGEYWGKQRQQPQLRLVN